MKCLSLSERDGGQYDRDSGSGREFELHRQTRKVEARARNGGGPCNEKIRTQHLEHKNLDL
jgi:hypothetical protein